MALTARQAIELFHVVFLRALVAKGDLLVARAEAEDLTLTKAQRAWVPDAIERAMSISFDDYASKVVAFLDPTQAELFRERAAWDAMQDAVVARLEALR
jgi:hypothetical protein